MAVDVTRAGAALNSSGPAAQGHWKLLPQGGGSSARQQFRVETRPIDLPTVPDAAADFAAEPPGAWLMARVPWTSAEHRIRAVGADAATAAMEIVYPGLPHERVARVAPMPPAGPG